jgi:hypothetical protein
MAISRRFFLKSGTLTAVSAGFLFGAGSLVGQKRRAGWVLAPGIPGAAQRDLLFYATRETFEPYIGSIFRARGARGEVLDLKLIRVTGYKPKALTRIATTRSAETNSFSLTLTASGQLPAFSNIPALYHAALGKLELFLTPQGENNGVFFYEAVINHVL